MKQFFFAFVALAGLSFTSCKEDATKKVKEENVASAELRDEASTKLPVMTFEETEYDFGNIKQGEEVEHVFKFKNTGDAPLIITDARSSCGCTVPEKPEEPVSPGETGEILVKYNGSGRNGISKTVTITANTANGTEQLKIKAFVEPKEAS